MNLCIITSSFPSHPADLAQAPFLVPFIQELQKRGHSIFVFTQDREGRKEPFLEGVQVRWFPWMGSDKPLVHLNPFRPLDGLRIGNLFLKGRKALLPFIKENKVDACLGLWVLPGGAFAHYAFRRHGTPYSVWALGSDIQRYGRNPFLRRVMKRIIRDARTVFADGFDLSKKVEKDYGKKCSFLATTRFLARDVACNVSTEEPFKVPPSPYRFLFVGRLERVKGIDLLLQAMALLKEENLHVHLTMIGGGGMEAWARGFVKKQGLEKYVSLTGNVSDPMLARQYGSCDCVVIPSRSESIPLVFSEALQFNKEMIVTDVGDMGTLGRRYGVASVVPPEDPLALKEMMKGRIESRDKKTDGEGEVKRAELRRFFDIETSVERFLADYR